MHQTTDRDLIDQLFLMLKENSTNLYIHFLFLFFVNKFIRKTLIRTFVNLVAILGKISRTTIIAEKLKIFVISSIILVLELLAKAWVNKTIRCQGLQKIQVKVRIYTIFKKF